MVKAAAEAADRDGRRRRRRRCRRPPGRGKPRDHGVEPADLNDAAAKAHHRGNLARTGCPDRTRHGRAAKSPPRVDVSPNVGAPRRRAGAELQPTPLAAAATTWQASSTSRVGPMWRGGDFSRRPSAPLWAGDLLRELRVGGRGPRRTWSTRPDAAVWRAQAHRHGSGTQLTVTSQRWHKLGDPPTSVLTRDRSRPREATPRRDPRALRLARRQPGPPGNPRRGGSGAEARHQGSTPVPSLAEVRKLLDCIDTGSLARLRDRSASRPTTGRPTPSTPTSRPAGSRTDGRPLPERTGREIG